MSHDVFISYASKDKAVADNVCRALESVRFRCWIAPRDIPPGADYTEALMDAIIASRVLVLIFSGESNASVFVKREIERAVSHKVPIVTYRIAKVDPSGSLELTLSSAQWLDEFSLPVKDRTPSLIAAVGLLLGRATTTSADARGMTAAPSASTSTMVSPAPSPSKWKRWRKAIVGVGLLVASAVACCGVWAIGGNALTNSADSPTQAWKAGSPTIASSASDAYGQADPACGPAVTLIALFQAANPDSLMADVKSNAAFSLLLHSLFRTCADGGNTIDDRVIRDAVVSTCNLVSDEKYASMLSTLDASTDGASLPLLSGIDESKLSVDCVAVNAFLDSEEGSQLKEMMDGIGGFDPNAGSSAGGRQGEDTEALYASAAEMWAKIKEGYSLPGGATRSRIMTTAMCEEWDVKIIDQLEAYLAADPPGVRSEEARALLDEAKSSDLLEPMASLRPALCK